MSIKKNKNQLIISILVGVAIFAVTYQFVIRLHEENTKQREEIEKLKMGVGVNPSAVSENNTIYVVAKTDLSKGHIISSEDVELKDIKMKMNGTFKDVKVLDGAKVTKDITAGNPIPKASVSIQNGSSDEPKEGFRAVPATVQASRITPFIEDGTYIDIYTAENTIQASNVRILKVLDAASKSNKLIIFEIKEEDVEPFIYGMTKDKIIPVQKNRKDGKEYSFSYDPFKYSSYTISNEELEEMNAMNIPASDNNYIPVNNGKKINQTVEVIQGNVKQTLDF